MSELKPCPKCKKLPQVGKDTLWRINVRCLTRACAKEYETGWLEPDKAIAAWNRRSDPNA